MKRLLALLLVPLLHSGCVRADVLERTASASIAARASVRSAAGVDVTASIVERPSASATAASTSTGNAIGGSAVVANFGNHANATIGNSAQVDAAGAIKASSDFAVKPEDHGIKIPGVVRQNIAQEITVKVRLDYAKM
jgi:hypothetical protein